VRAAIMIEKWNTHTPKCIIDDWQGEFKIIREPVDTTVYRLGADNAQMRKSSYIPSTTVST